MPIIKTSPVKTMLLLILTDYRKSCSHNYSNIPSNNIYYSLNILRFCDNIKYKNCTLSYKAFNNVLPCIIQYTPLVFERRGLMTPPDFESMLKKYRSL